MTTRDLLACLDDLLGASEQPRGTDELRRWMKARLEALGLQDFAYLAIGVPDSERGTGFLGSYPKVWTDHYTERRFVEVDPVIRLARKSATPFAWRDPAVRSRMTKNARRVFDEARDFKILNGLTIPIHEPGTQFATLNLSTDLGDKMFDDLVAAEALKLTLLAQFFHAQARGRFFENPDLATAPLSPRERECLLWTARGKSAWEIGAILSISERTVVFHLSNAMHKLGVHNKIYGVVKAIMAGLIVP